MTQLPQAVLSTFRLIVAGTLTFCAFGEAAAQANVNSGGQASFSVPIVVPPGIAGMVPKLSLEYGGRAAMSGLPQGWGLNGLSVIARCGSTPATDKVRKGVKYNGEDKFCLDGQRLILTDSGGTPVSGQVGYGNPSTEYRTEADMLARVRAYGGSPSTGPDSFKVWTKDGLVYEYTTKILTTGRPTAAAFAWPVSKVSDAAGNYMTMAYQTIAPTFNGSPGTEWGITEIRYTGNGAQAPATRVQFNYQTRVDASEAYHEAAKVVSTKLLSSVTTYVNAQGGGQGLLVNTLTLGYTQGQNSGKSLLAWTQNCGGSGPANAQCAPKSEFNYTPGPSAAFTTLQHPSFQAETFISTDGKRGVLVGDFNGDGRLDLLRWSDDKSANGLFLSAADGNGGFSRTSQDLTGVQIGHSNGCAYAIVGDFNADSISDVMVVNNPDAAGPGVCSGIGYSAQIYLGSTSGSFQSAINVRKQNGLAMQLPRKDPIYFAQNQCSGMDNCYLSGVSLQVAGTNFYVMDVNGDGIPDIVVTNSRDGQAGPAPTDCDPGERTCIFLGSAQLWASTRSSLRALRTSTSSVRAQKRWCPATSRASTRPIAPSSVT